MFALINLQGALQLIAYDPVLHDVSFTPLPLTGVQLAEAMTKMMIEQGTSQWKISVRKFVIPE